MATDQRIYACYQSVRLGTERKDRKHTEIPRTPGSFFNHAVLTVAQRLRVPAAEVREALVRERARRQGVTVEEARAVLAAQREAREATHREGHCSVNGWYSRSHREEAELGFSA